METACDTHTRSRVYTPDRHAAWCTAIVRPGRISTCTTGSLASTPLDDGMNDAGRETTFFGPKRQSEERAAERSLAFTHDRTRSVDDLY